MDFFVWSEIYETIYCNNVIVRYWSALIYILDNPFDISGNVDRAENEGFALLWYNYNINTGWNLNFISNICKLSDDLSWFAGGRQIERFWEILKSRNNQAVTEYCSCKEEYCRLSSLQNKYNITMFMLKQIAL